MPQIINTNIASLNSQRNLNKSQSQLGVSLQRLSSGLRINSAKDDAAGLAISERFTTQIRGLNQAARNANDGISLAQTAEGALGGVTANLQRIRELAVQSANATNSASDRAALQAEVTQLTAEIQRVSETSSFNGVQLLDGSFTDQEFQVGANAGETVSIDTIISADTSTLGQNTVATYNNTTAINTSGLATGQLLINGVDVAASGAVAADAADIAAAISATGTGVAATAENVQDDIAFGTVTGTPAQSAVASSISLTGFTTATSASTGEAFQIDIDGVAFYNKTDAGASVTVTAADIQAAIVSADGDADNTFTHNGATYTYTGDATTNNLSIQKSDGTLLTIGVTSTFSTAAGGFNAGPITNGADATDTGTVASPQVDADYTLSIDGNVLDFTAALADNTIDSSEVFALINAIDGYTATAGASGAGYIKITKDDGSNFVLTEGGADSALAEGLAGGAGSTTFRGTVTSVTSTGADLTVGGTAAGNAGLGAAPASTTAVVQAGTGVGSVDISTASGAQTALDTIDRALNAINSGRADLGAIQNRFESVVSNITIQSENLSAARSRIQDTDFAEETASLTRNQILQQAGVSILSQANALPQLALSLLQ